MANFYCPGFYENAIIYRELEHYKRNYPYCFYDNVQITHVYGCFPSCIWNGGSCWIDTPVPRSVMRDVFYWWKDNTDITIQITFTNPVLEDTDVYDRYSNAILEEAVSILGEDRLEILVSSPILEQYIRNKYANIPITKSIIGMTGMENDCKEIEDYVSQLNIYPKIVVPRKKVNDKEFILNFPNELKNKVELLCTDPCDINCPRLYSHYIDMSRKQLWENVVDDSTNCTAFATDEDRAFKYSKYLIYQITPMEIAAYETLGWTEFKISGRLTSAIAPLQVVPYLIKPEYVKDVLSMVYIALYGPEGAIPYPSFWEVPI